MKPMYELLRFITIYLAIGDQEIQIDLLTTASDVYYSILLMYYG